MSQLSIRAKVNDYLGSSVGVELRYTNTKGDRVGYPSPLGGLMWSMGIWKPIDLGFGLRP